LLAALDRLAPAERQRHLGLVNARTVDELRARLLPAVTTRQEGEAWLTRVVQPSLDGRDTLELEVRADSRLVRAARTGDVVSLASRSTTETPFTLRIITTGKPLTPLARQEIFNPEFLSFLAAARGADSTSMR